MFHVIFLIIEQSFWSQEENYHLGHVAMYSARSLLVFLRTCPLIGIEE
jgi:hypothetical protein